MEFRILGPLEVWEGDRRLPLGGAKHRALLAILILNANRVVATDRLIELLWGDEPPETVNNTLQVSVSQLRKVLEPDHVRGTPHRVLVSQEPGYLLRVLPAELDLGRFEQLCEEARRARLDGHPDLAAAALREALALWRGPPLADLASESFAIAEVSRLNELALQTTEDRIEADLALGRHADLIGELEALVAEHPLRERLGGQLMLALYLSGRQAEASEVFHRTRSRLVDELGMDPGPGMQTLFKQILRQDPSLEPLPRVRSDNLPLQLTSFVGRNKEVADVIQLLAGHRLLTLTGPGGIGKTRLALQVAADLRENYRDGVWFVELAPLADGDMLPQAIAATLGLREPPGRSLIEALSEYVRARQLLLVLDNCEHLIHAVALVADRLLRSAPRVRILATSREALRISGEVARLVPSLSVPEGAQVSLASELTDYDAVALFLDRALTALPDSTLPAGGVHKVVEICTRLDGIPLAIELAAGKLKFLSLEELSTRLQDRFRILTGGSRVALPRQQTLRATIDWSYELLTVPEQALLRRLSVFAGAFTVEAAEAICSGDGAAPTVVFDLLSGLVAKSMVMAEGKQPPPRYRLLETIRVYAAERLLEAGESDDVRDRHLDWYLNLAEQAKIGLRGADQVTWLSTLQASSSDLRAALRWAISARPNQVVLLVVGLNRFWFLQGNQKDAREAAQAAIASTTAPGIARARALTIAGQWAFWDNDFTNAVELLSQRLSMDRTEEKAEDPEDRGLALTILAIAQSILGANSEGLDLMTRAIGLLRSSGDTWGLALALSNSGYMNFLAGDHGPRTRAQIEESLNLFEALGDRFTQMPILDSLAQVAVANGDLDEARSCWSQVLRISITSGSSPIYPAVIVATLEGLAQLALFDDGPERTLRLLAAAERMRAAVGFPSGLAWSGKSPESLRENAERLLGATAARIWAEGAAMTLDEAIRYALEVDAASERKRGVTDPGEGQPVASAPTRRNSLASRQRQQGRQG